MKISKKIIPISLSILFFAVLSAIICQINSENEEFIDKVRCPGCNVIIITIDTLRADHVGYHGYRFNTTPNLDKLAEKSVIFTNFYVTLTSTQPSHYSLFSSLAPYESGYIINIMALDKDFAPKGVMISEILKNNAYYTGAITSSPNFNRDSGFPKGFDTFYFPGDEFSPMKVNNATMTVDKALAWLKEHSNEKFYLWVHLYDPHDPYDAPDKFNVFKTEDSSMEPKDIKFIDSYDAEVHYADYEIGRIISFMDENYLFNNTILIITSDHGEGLYSHRGERSHGTLLYEEQIKAIFMIHAKGINGTYDTLSQNTQVFPALLTILNISKTDLKKPALLEKGVEIMIYESDRCIDPQVTECYPFNSALGKSIAIRYKNLKYINTPAEDGAHEEIYNLANDPKETQNIINSTFAKYLFRLWILSVDAKIRIPDKIKLDNRSEEYNSLKSLGYLS